MIEFKNDGKQIAYMCLNAKLMERVRKKEMQNEKLGYFQFLVFNKNTNNIISKCNRKPQTIKKERKEEEKRKN